MTTLATLVLFVTCLFCLKFDKGYIQTTNACKTIKKKVTKERKKWKNKTNFEDNGKDSGRISARSPPPPATPPLPQTDTHTHTRAAWQPLGRTIERENVSASLAMHATVRLEFPRPLQHSAAACKAHTSRRRGAERRGGEGRRTRVSASVEGRGMPARSPFSPRPRGHSLGASSTTTPPLYLSLSLLHWLSIRNSSVIPEHLNRLRI
ncbi:hypothetical protein E2C01_027990 [Portunus trituberculatus]|uniref:Secreted protein n=1 Tax=Portunus trituberculatus TaxID=210409 RepID=A0A5B7EME9_PORTR|nr:hypothetical protein [Portunus trituberculatus]